MPSGDEVFVWAKWRDQWGVYQLALSFDSLAF